MILKIKYKISEQSEIQTAAKRVSESTMFKPKREVSFVHIIPVKIYDGVPGGWAILPSLMTNANSAASSNINEWERVKRKQMSGTKNDNKINGMSLRENLLFILFEFWLLIYW